MVVPAGIEPATLGLWVPRSNQLSYGTKWAENEKLAFLFCECRCRRREATTVPWRCFLAEGTGFEPARLSPSGFQDQRLQPLGHPSACYFTIFFHLTPPLYSRDDYSAFVCTAVTSSKSSNALSNLSNFSAVSSSTGTLFSATYCKSACVTFNPASTNAWRTLDNCPASV